MLLPLMMALVIAHFLLKFAAARSAWLQFLIADLSNGVQLIPEAILPILQHLLTWQFLIIFLTIMNWLSRQLERILLPQSFLPGVCWQCIAMAMWTLSWIMTVLIR